MKPFNVSRLALLAVLLVFSSLAWPVSSRAATLTVTNLGDTGAAGQLRTLINGAAAGDTITLPPGTIALTAGQLQVSRDLTILGADAGACAPSSWPCSVIDGTKTKDRVLFIFDAVVAPNVTMSDVVIQGGKPGRDGGGGILNFGHLALSNAVVANNQATGGRTRADVGGGLRNAGGATMTLNNVAVTGNVGMGGGGIFNELGGTATLTDVTVSGNQTQDILGGAGLYNAGTATLNRVTVSGNTTLWFGGGIANGGTATLTDVTVSGNAALSAAGIFSCSSNDLFCLLSQGNPLTTLTNVTIADNIATGLSGVGGILILNGSMPLTNVIVSANTTPNCSGVVTSLGHNLDSGNTCGFAAAGDLNSTDPVLGPLQDNGGLTLTHALLAGSLAIDAGTNVGCPPSDQRGVARPQGAACDIGAYEVPNGATPPPAPVIASGPVGPTKETAATFVFSDADPAATLLCTLDDSAPAAFAPCTSPQSYGPGLAEGSHTFFVKAHNLAGDSATASFAWTIDLTAPGTVIDSMPLDPTNQTTASFTFHATELASTLECSLDAAAFAACASPAAFPGLADGLHSFAVRATDPAGNIGAAASFSWTIDTQAPDTVIDSAPPALTTSNTAAFTFHATGAIAFACQLDALPAAPCTSGITYPGLGDGSHAFTVQATDAAGNTGPAASFSWTIDTQAPGTVIDSAPPALTTNNTATFTFHATGAVAFACQLDAQPAAPCTSGVTYPGLGEGPHTFAVHATDAAGNTGPAATASWVVDQTAPSIAFGAPAPAPNANGWNNTNVSIPFTAADPLSGLATVTPSPLVLSAEGAAVTGSVTATDNAGNSTTVASLAVKIDKTPPTVAFGAPSPAPNANGWNNTDVSIPFTAADPLSGLATVTPSPLVLSAEGAAVTGSVTATDNAGNSTTVASPAVKIDKTPPTVTLTTPTDGAAYTLGDPVIASYSCTDPLSGIASCAGPVPSGSPIDTAAVGSHTFTVTATDKAGNPATHTVTYSVTAAPTPPPGKQLTALSPAKVWIGLKNSADVGLRVDLLAEVFLNGTLVGQGQLDREKSGGSGFKNAILYTIPLRLTGGPVPVPAGAQLEFKLSVRRTCLGKGQRSGTVRLWYNGQPIDSSPKRDAGMRFGATIDLGTGSYFAREGAALSGMAGPSRLSIDQFVDSSPGCPFTPIGTWSLTLP